MLLIVDSTGKAAAVKMFLHAFMHENALNPLVFPNLRRFEVEIVAMTAWMLHGPVGVVGGVTSGGTESILMAMKTYRDRARDLFPQIKNPELVTNFDPYCMKVVVLHIELCKNHFTVFFFVV